MKQKKKKLSRHEYYQYMQSEAWQQKRKAFYSSNLYKRWRKEGKWVCYGCGADDKKLDLHHRTYKRLGNEHIAIDLVPVCRECHKKIHTLVKESNLGLWTATKEIGKTFKKGRATEKKREKKIWLIKSLIKVFKIKKEEIGL